ncbi:MAG: S41 family peptidase [Oligosphaeraceae bacterium]
MKKVIFLLVFAVLLLCNVFVGYSLQQTVNQENFTEAMEKMELLLEVLQQVRANYLEQEGTEVGELFDAAIKGMVLSLDPFSSFMTPPEFKEMEEEDVFGGIGVQVHLQEGILTVSSVFRDTPASEAGLMAGDQILAIDGENQQGKKLDEIVGKLRGAPGTEVKVTVRRPKEEGEETWDMTMTRREIQNPTINDVHIIQGTKTGFVRIDSFTEATTDQFRSAIQELTEQGMDSLILDLRGNPGGRVKACVDVLSCFLPKDTLVATLEGRGGEIKDVYYTRKLSAYLPPEIPVAVLGDRGTASAAEIAISCLRDYHRAVFIGDRTFGKALVQDVMNLSGGNGLTLTVAQYYTKERTPIQGRGIRPDIPEPLTRQQYLDIAHAKNQEEIDRMDPNIQTALAFFAQGAQWPVYQGKSGGDYEDILPHWRRDDHRQYQMQDFRLYPFSVEESREGEEEAAGEETPASQEN